jgi:hypothetical protein
MTGLRKLRSEDITAIKDYLVEARDIWQNIEQEVIDVFPLIGPSFTYINNDEIIACCGAVKTKDTWEIWAAYSSKASCFQRARAAIMFRRKLYNWKKEHPEDRVIFHIPTDLPNAKRYGDFIGATFNGTEQDLFLSGITNNIYEVL